MEKLFELSAELTLDAASFLRGLAQAEQAARQAASTLERLQNAAQSSWSAVATGIQAVADKMQASLTLQTPASVPGFATGIGYVPYNDFPARLHEGEAVLTRLEAAQWRSQSAAPSLDLSALADHLAGALSGMTVQMDGQAVGQLVAPTVSREIARQTRTKHH